MALVTLLVGSAMAMVAAGRGEAATVPSQILLPRPAQIVSGAGTGGGAHVRAFDGNGTLRSTSFLAENGSSGQRVAVGDVDGNGTDEIVTASGPGVPGAVRVFGVTSAGGVTLQDITFPYGLGWMGGISVADDAEAVRAQVGLLSEVPGLYERMTAPEYLDFFGRAQGMETALRRRRIDELLELFGLAPRAGVWMGSFSKGMRQKVALIRATLHHPSVLLLDEPTSSMDPAGARLTWDYIMALKTEGIAVVVCTHNLRETAKVADRLAVMAQGRILAEGTLTELQAALGLKPRYIKTLVPGLEDIYMEVMGRAGRLHNVAAAPG